MKLDKTERGFDIGNFKDLYDYSCSLQHSSLATEDAVWFGIDDPKPRIMASKAAANGVETTQTSGWVAYPIPKDVIMSTRMHLTRDQMAEIIPYLIGFVETGRIQRSDTWLNDE